MSSGSAFISLFPFGFLSRPSLSPAPCALHACRTHPCLPAAPPCLGCHAPYSRCWSHRASSALLASPTMPAIGRALALDSAVIAIPSHQGLHFSHDIARPGFLPPTVCAAYEQPPSSRLTGLQPRKLGTHPLLSALKFFYFLQYFQHLLPPLSGLRLSQTVGCFE